MAEASLEAAGMTCNKNGIPFDPEKPMITSGLGWVRPRQLLAGLEKRNLGR